MLYVTLHMKRGLKRNFSQTRLNAAFETHLKCVSNSFKHIPNAFQTPFEFRAFQMQKTHFMGFETPSNLRIIITELSRKTTLFMKVYE